jgi:hypothetical protein
MVTALNSSCIWTDVDLSGIESRNVSRHTGCTVVTLMELNISEHRGGTSVWQRRDRPFGRSPWLGAACVAGALLMAGADRRRRAGWLLMGAGSALAWWAPSWMTRCREGLKGRLGEWRMKPDEVSEASEESFPASDAPSWTTTGSKAPMRPRTM